MALDLRFRPIATWPGTPTRHRKRSPFNVQWLKILDELERELAHVGAKEVVVEAFLGYGDIRNDGWPRSGARPSQPGVVMYFTSKHGPLRYACDTYTDYQGNIRAISLTLTALRAVERYGAANKAEQYRGWAQLPETSSAAVNATAAAGVLVAYGYDVRTSAVSADTVTHNIVASVDTCRTMLRAALKATHPDTGGSADAFQRVQDARAVLAAHHGVTL